ncbi:MAG: CDP-diacylglycerol--glycerol-3-phosphate 3-phosphatidyltransferase [Actinomycetota bacterium]|jgi:cardiolipin synthase|nr:MAG: CDP-diacylglycerol--glycerol-3-phosphate 3-phosphatidyltransferase [Actinomycetota bacterium]
MGAEGSDGGRGAPRRVLTLPNLISAARIAAIPVFVGLILRPDTTAWGLALFAAVLATDWVDGLLARRTGQVSELGKLLDPVADRLAIGAGLVALVARGAFPPWAAAVILGRDALVLAGGALALWRRGVRIEVRWLGKVATFTLMLAVPWIAWGRLGLPLAEAAIVCGWVAFAVGAAESWGAAAIYARDLRRALDSRHGYRSGRAAAGP